MENPQQTIEKQQGGDLPEGLIFVSSGSEAPEEDEDHEEGEIQDEDDEGDLKQQDLEDISSEEESTIRERMAALEAMDKRVGMMKKLVNRSSKHGDYLNEEDDMVNGKENFYYYYQQTYKHHPSLAYQSRSKVPAYKTPKEDNRHDSVTTKHQHTSHRPIAAKRHVKEVKSSKKSSSSYRRYKRRKYASPGSPSPTIARRPPSSDSEPEAVVDREYLKIACAIDNGKRQREDGQLGERNPLRKKLFQGTHKSRKFRMRSDEMLAATTDVVNVIVDSSSNEEDDVGGEGEEEEELQLRLLALSTKPIVREVGLGEIISDTFQIPSPPPPPSIGLTDGASDAVSAEEQELRLIALKTAVLKKHASRQKRRELDNERPYSPSDDIVLSPVRELPPTYDDGLYSDEREESVELIDDDDVQIVEPHYEHIDLLDSDDGKEPEVGGNDMEISPLGSPSERSIPGDVPQQLIEDDSQQPVDMELASSERSSNGSPVHGGVGDGDSCDSALFHRRSDLIPASPSETPDSMEEAEAEALRHLLLTKMRQKRNRVQEVQPTEESAKADVVLKEESVSMDVQYEETQSEAYSPVPPPKEVDEQELTMEEESSPRTSSEQPMQRKRRKKSHSNSISFAEVIDSKQSAIEIPPKPALVHTQKLVNNPNKLINLNRTAAPSPPIARTESPKDPAMVDTFVSRPVAKLVIQLGQSDSDSDVDFGSPSPQKPTSVASGGTASPGVRFEEQLEMFLKSVRSKSIYAANVCTTEGDTKETDNPSKRQEQPEQQVVASTKSLDSVRLQQQQAQPSKSLVKKATVSSSTMVTPTAVKHLSKSAQLEYMRLVERMAQLERDKLARQNFARTCTAINSDKSISKHPPLAQQQTSSSLPAVDQHRTDPRFGKSPGRRKQSQSQDAIAEPAPLLDPLERKLQQIRSSIPNLSEASRNRLLHTAERHLEKHSESFVNELEQHNAIILDAQKARRELYHLESRIDLLREKLSMLERIRERHRHRSLEKFTTLQVTRAKVLSSRKRSGELERMCYHIGRAIKGETYQLPASTSIEMVQQQLRILVAETQQLRTIRKPSLEQFKEEMIANHKRRLATWQEASLQAEPEDPIQEEDEEPMEEEEVVVELEQGSKQDKREESKVESTATVSEEDAVKEAVEFVPNEATDEVPSMEEHVEEQPVSSANESIAPPGLSAPDVPVIKQITDNEASSQVEETDADQSEVENETITLVPSDAIRQQTNDPPIRNDTDPDGTEFRIEKYTSPLMSLKQGTFPPVSSARTSLVASASTGTASSNTLPSGRHSSPADESCCRSDNNSRAKHASTDEEKKLRNASVQSVV